MNLERDWLWDKKISVKEAQAILRDPDGRHFLSLAGALLSRKNTPKEVFKHYLDPVLFARNWHKIKRQMRKDDWNDPRIEYWQAVYELLKERYQKKGIDFKIKKPIAKPRNEFCKPIADKIKSVRKGKGYTQSELARKLKVSQQVISRIENGNENISLGTLKKIADAMGVEVRIEIGETRHIEDK